jgi:hypothetical protein
VRSRDHRDHRDHRRRAAPVRLLTDDLHDRLVAARASAWAELGEPS